MKDFSKMTKAEKLKVLEEDYLERMKRKKQRRERLSLWLSIMIIVMIELMFLACLIISVVKIIKKFEPGLVVSIIINGFIVLCIFIYSAWYMCRNEVSNEN